jgi:hypothetical protein
VKNFRWWAVVGVAGLGVLAGCGSGSSSSSTVSLRLANATLTHPSLDLLVNSTVSLSATATDSVSAYVAPAAGGNTLQVDDAGSATALTTTIPTLTGGLHYTLLAYESGGTVKTVVLGEDDAAPATGAAQMRFYDTALDAGKLDVYVTAPGADLTTVSPTTGFGILTAPMATALFTYSPGTYEVRVTGAGNKNDLRADISVTLTSQQIANVALTPAAGGVLLNGSTLIEQGTYTAARNTNARVRLAAAVSGGATVAATATGGAAVTTIASGVSPAFGYYVLVPANSALNISVNGQSVGAPAATLAAGTDATLLVYGAPGTAVASLIGDDNRLPSDPTTVKLRLINGITGSAGALTLTANTAPVGVGIAPAAASSYVSVPGSTNAMNLSLTSSTAGAFPPNTSYILNPGSVYTVMAAGDVSAPLLFIR